MDAVTTTWGDNTFSQAPGTVEGQWQHIAAGAETSLFIRNGKLFALGSNSNNCLSEEKDALDTLSRVDFAELEVFRLRAISCGLDHYVAIDDKGRIISWGANNEFGQVGHGEFGVLRRILPQVLSLPQYGHRARQVSCGENHTLLLTETGQVWAWGSNTFGQLGTDNSKEQNRPKLVSHALACLPVRQVSAGHSHSLCHVVTGDAYSWGKNNHGQLGLGSDFDTQAQVNVPCRVTDIDARSPLRAVAAGGAHSAFLHRSGRVALSGDNRSGQLGYDPEEVNHSHLPLICEGSIADMRVRQVLLGEAHTLLLVESPEGCTLFGMGLNTENQCGPGAEKIITPTRIALGDAVQQFPLICGLAAGYRHNIALIKQAPPPDLLAGEAFEFLRSSSVPEAMAHLCLTRSSSMPEANENDQKRQKVDLPAVSVPLSVTSSDDDESMGLPADRSYAKSTGTPFELPWQRKGCQAKATQDTTRFSVALKVDNQSLCVAQKVTQAGVVEDVPFWTLSTSELCALTALPPSDVARPANSGDDQLKNKSNMKMILTGCFSVPHVVNASFCFPGTHVLRFDVDRFLQGSASLTDKYVFDAVREGLGRLEHASFLTRPDQLRCLLVYLLLPIWNREHFKDSVEATEFYERLIMVVAFLPSLGRQSLIKLIQDECSVLGAKERLIPNCVAMSNTLIEVCLQKQQLIQPLWESVLLLDIVWCGCQQWIQNKNIAKSSFALTKLSQMAPQMELQLFVQHSKKKVLNLMEFVLEPWSQERAMAHPAKCGLSLASQSFMSHPHLVPVSFKQKVLQAENQDAHRREIQSNIMAPQQIVQALFGARLRIPEGDVFFVLEVQRDNILQDAICALACASPEEMRRPLRVRFKGEDGIDEGGVKREFFKLLMQQLFDADFGMFKVNDESGALWFNVAADLLGVPPANYCLIGNIVGLAVYNNLPGVNVPFPAALFKKLKGEKCSLEDLAELSPAYANSIDSILNWTPHPSNTSPEAINQEFEDTFGLDFTISYNAVGIDVVVNLGPDGGPEKTVTYDNRDEFCNYLLEYLFDGSVKSMFDPFNEGFKKVCGSFVLDVLAWDDLLKIVRAEPHLDLEQLRTSARYEGGYSDKDPYMQMFWDVLSKFEPRTRRQFLSFVTGCDFAPVGGIAELKIVIQKNGVEPTRALPTAHTCFNLLLLPEYGCPAKLERLLRIAVENSEGFGLQ